MTSSQFFQLIYVYGFDFKHTTLASLNSFPGSKFVGVFSEDSLCRRIYVG